MRRFVVLACLVAGCGFSSKGANGDAGPTGDDDAMAGDDASPPTGSTCGNSNVEPGEDCDDPLDPACIQCHFACGNGVVDLPASENCDTGIASGAGACPTACDDSDACTTDTLSGTGCAAKCEFAAITAAADGDGCCPAGANANTDSDCAAACGNSIVEAGEVCDTGIASGAGACPTTCDDGMSCTTNNLMNMGTCQAACVFTPITTNTPGDGCCRSGATAAQDSDCAGCGNGVVEAGLGETCDTGIANGAGSCPTTCASDGNACTNDIVVNTGTCQAACTHQPITAAANGDGCCPTGANANTDTDCQPVCGNTVKEGTEQCDDGNMNNTDACSNTCTTNVVPTAFRFDDTLKLVDPHAFTTVFGFCVDITSNLNDAIKTAVDTDGSDADSYLDLSPVAVFTPLGQTSATSPLGVYFANCPTATSCMADPTATPTILTATNQSSGTCLSPVAGSTRASYNPTANSPAGSTASPCFSSNTATVVNISLGGVPIKLYNARVGAVYSGSPATKLINGSLYGFLLESDANATVLPNSLPSQVAGKKLSAILAGGTGNCKGGTSSDKDTAVIGGNTVSGWWMYLNFAAPTTAWSP
ncbi:MAG TPA: DUF4215 domain-containing protein [Kofleriaceae bacterium]